MLSLMFLQGVLTGLSMSTSVSEMVLAGGYTLFCCDLTYQVVMWPEVTGDAEGSTLVHAGPCGLELVTTCLTGRWSKTLHLWLPGCQFGFFSLGAL